MTSNKILLFLLLISNIGVSQENADIGFMAGGATYFGDVNMETPFRTVRPGAKIFYRYNLHSRLALRGDITHARIAGNDADAGFDYQALRNHQFSRNLTEMSAFVEFNFFKFELSDRKTYLTPYLGGGLGVLSVEFNFSSKFTENITIPFGMGAKIGINNRFTLGLEYTLHRTFRDDLDQISDWRYNSEGKFALKQRANPQNDDWFTFFGLFLSIKLKDCVTCPAYF